MKKFTRIVFGLIIFGFSIQANASNSECAPYNDYDGQSYIFVENGVEFSVYPDGQFDFVFVEREQQSELFVSIYQPEVNVSYNSGYDYEMYVQYDDYGAVIQIEDVPVYYDEYGRIVQAGEVEIRYVNRRMVSVGGLYIHYNSYGYYSYYTGYINRWNRYYFYRPWHVYYGAPLYATCVVYDYPYRRYYTPYRHSYYTHTSYYHNRGQVAYHNARRNFYRPGSRIHYENGRSSINRSYNPNRVNTAVNRNSGRSNKTKVRSNSTNREGYAQVKHTRKGSMETTNSRTRNSSRKTTGSSKSSSRVASNNRSSQVRTNKSSSQRSNTTSRSENRSRVSSNSKKRTRGVSAPIAKRSSSTSRSKPSGERSSNNSRRNSVKKGKGL
jgi:hypothetical protein